MAFSTRLNIFSWTETFNSIESSNQESLNANRKAESSKGNFPVMNLEMHSSPLPPKPFTYEKKCGISSSLEDLDLYHKSIIRRPLPFRTSTYEKRWDVPSRWDYIDKSSQYCGCKKKEPCHPLKLRLEINKHNFQNQPICKLRTFSNWAKSSLMLKGISKFSGDSFVGLDLGCSQGGDLKKWFYCKIRQLYLVESDLSALLECQKRYSGLQLSWGDFYPAKFLHKDFAKDILEIPEAVDIVSSQMVVHKAFQSEAMAECFAKNVSQLLKYGGNFVVSLTNASKIVEMLRNSPDGKSFGNSAFHIYSPRILPENSVPEFGFSFEFTVGSKKFVEFLVPFLVLKKIMAKHGLVLEEKKSFLEMFFDARRNPDEVQLMKKLGVARLDYTKNRRKLKPTMSDEEIEAASFYEALIFKKVF